MTPTDRDYRLRSTRRIGELFDAGRRAEDRLAMMVGAPGDWPLVRMAFAVSRRHGPAVRRNRLRRLCRQAFRQVRRELPGGWDFVLIPRLGREPGVAELAGCILRLARRIIDAGGADEPPPRGADT